MNPDATAERSPLPPAVWLLSWVSFFADVSSEMVYPLLPLFMVGVLGSSRTQLGVMEGGAVLLVSAMTAFAGWRSDAMGKRVPWIRVGYGLPMLGKAVIALAVAWPLVVAGRLLDRFGKGLRGAPRDALIADAVSADQRGRAFGVHRAFDTAGALTGVLLSALLLWWLTGTPARHGADAHVVIATPAWVYRAIFGVGAGLGLASLALTFMVRETEGAARAEAKSDAAPSTPSQALRAMPRGYWATLGVMVLFSLANSSDTFLLLRASDAGLSPWTVVLLYALYNLSYTVLAYPIGALSDRLGRWGIIALGWALYALVYAGFARLTGATAWSLWPLMVLYGVYMALTDGVGKALIADHAPRAHRGLAMGLFYGATGVTTLLASLAVGLAWDRVGASTAFLFGAGFALLALVALALMRALKRI